ncbi:MAG: DUF6686 family protein [Bacteroidota bacterium]
MQEWLPVTFVLFRINLNNPIEVSGTGLNLKNPVQRGVEIRHLMACTPESLVDIPGLNISICPGCQRIGFAYNNILLGFDKHDFKNFVTSFTDIDFDRKAVLFPGGEKQLIVNSAHHDIQFNFRKEEFETICEHANQALTLLNAKEILSY